MQLTFFTDYGLRTLIYLAAFPDRRCSVREISAYYDISRNHLVKVVHRLAQLDYITSAKGKGGGLFLVKSTLSLPLGDLVLSLEKNMDIVECFNTETNRCRITEACQLKHFIYEANAAFIASLNTRTLADCVLPEDVFL